MHCCLMQAKNFSRYSSKAFINPSCLEKILPEFHNSLSTGAKGCREQNPESRLLFKFVGSRLIPLLQITHLLRASRRFRRHIPAPGHDRKALLKVTDTGDHDSRRPCPDNVITVFSSDSMAYGTIKNQRIWNSEYRIRIECYHDLHLIRSCRYTIYRSDHSFISRRIKK